jgi:hypothetical protein
MTIRSAREELASFGAWVLGFVGRFNHLANGFVRREWLRSARVASFGAGPPAPATRFGAIGFVRRPVFFSGHSHTRPRSSA